MSEEMGELTAALPDCEVVVRFDDSEALTPDLRAALSELADAMYAEQVADHDAEVAGFSLTLGSLGLQTSPLSLRSGDSCWGYTEGGHCTWYSGGVGPTSCTIHSMKK